MTPVLASRENGDLDRWLRDPMASMFPGLKGERVLHVSHGCPPPMGNMGFP